MKISTIKAVFALIIGGPSGFVKYLVTIFNDQVLTRIQDKDTALKYLKDVQAVQGLVSSLIENHKSDISEKKFAAAKAVLETIQELTKALEDFHVDDPEIEGIVEKIKAAINAWKAAK